MKQDNLKKCKVCGKTFKAESPRQKYCSDNCYHESNRINALDYYNKTNPKYEHVCPICHENFIPEHNGVKYCSDSCNKEAQRLNRRRHYLMKVMDAEYYFDVYTVRFNRDTGLTSIFKDGEVVVSDEHDLYNAFNRLIGYYVSNDDKDSFKRIRRSKEFQKLQDYILKMKFELLPELKDIKRKLWL